MKKIWKTEGVRKQWDRYKYAALVVLIGAGLLLWPSGKRDTGTSSVSAAAEETTAETIQAEMEEILGQISGVGQVRVMLTADTDGERQLARDTELTYRGEPTGAGGLLRPLRDRFDRRRGRGCTGGDPAGVSDIPGRSGGLSGRRSAPGASGGDRGGVGADRAFGRPHRGGKMAVIIWRRKNTMKARWKRNAVVATMAVLVCAAVALNWRYTSDQAVSQMEQAQSEETGTKILGQATLVSGVGGWRRRRRGSGRRGRRWGSCGRDGSLYRLGLLCLGPPDPPAGPDSAISLLQEAAEQENADAAVANEASEGIQVLAAYTLQEAQIENLVTAKGYQDCVAFLGEDGVSVVVATDTGELTAEDVAKITDIAMSETGLPAGSVKIMAAN